MSEIKEFGSILRLVEDKKQELVGDKYRKSCFVKDNATDDVLVECDLYQKAIYSEILLTDNKHQTWKIKPNRKIMPTRWHVYSPFDEKTFEVRLPNFFIMMNPFSRTYLRLSDIQSGRKLKFVDLESGFFDRIFGGTNLIWSITDNNKVIAEIRYLAREEDEEEQKPKKKGFFARLKGWFRRADWSLQSYAAEPVISAPAFLALALVYNEVSSGPVE